MMGGLARTMVMMQWVFLAGMVIVAVRVLFDRRMVSDQAQGRGALCADADETRTELEERIDGEVEFARGGLYRIVRSDHAGAL